MTEPARLRPKAHSAESWARALGRLLRSCAKKRWYGTIRLDVHDGRVKRMLLEKSILDPDALARDDEDPIQSG